MSVIVSLDKMDEMALSSSSTRFDLDVQQLAINEIEPVIYVNAEELAKGELVYLKTTEAFGTLSSGIDLVMTIRLKVPAAKLLKVCCCK